MKNITGKVTYKIGKNVLVPTYDNPMSRMTWNFLNHIHAGEARFKIESDDEITIYHQAKNFNSGSYFVESLNENAGAGTSTVTFSLNPDFSISSTAIGGPIITTASGSWADGVNNKASSSYSARWRNQTLSGGGTATPPASINTSFSLGSTRTWTLSGSNLITSQWNFTIDITWSNDPTLSDFAPGNIVSAGVAMRVERTAQSGN